MGDSGDRRHYGREKEKRGNVPPHVHQSDMRCHRSDSVCKSLKCAETRINSPPVEVTNGSTALHAQPKCDAHVAECLAVPPPMNSRGNDDLISGRVFMESSDESTLAEDLTTF